MIDKLRVSTPGRICLFGEHQDYLNLPVIAMAISRRVNIFGSKKKNKMIFLDLPDINSKEIINLDKTIIYDKERDYFKSTLNVLKRYGYTFSYGFDCTVKGNIPINSGTSSSTALIVSWVKFLARMSDQCEEVNDIKAAKFAHEAEVIEFNEPGGMMDHFSTAVGETIFLDFYPEVSVKKINTNLGKFVLGDSGQPKDTKGILSRVKNEVLRAVKTLQNKFLHFDLRELELDELNQYKNFITDDQTDLLKATIKNFNITKKAVSLFTRPNFDHHYFGKLLSQHQNTLRETLKISTDKIDSMLQAAVEAGAYGGKINGSGGGGCMFVYAPENFNEVARAIENKGGKAFVIDVAEGVTIH